MSEQNEEIIDAASEATEEDAPDNFFIDILSGDAQTPSPKKLLTQRVRVGGEVQIRRTTRRDCKIHDELPLVADKFKEFMETSEVSVWVENFK